ncbi:MAG: TonB-dependent receptor [Gammaproteobacteria bacterium]|nr:TonB-dependent receptor [Gammaproteobacteria bacterium]
MADVMRLVPGIQVAYPQGNQIAVTYHGYGDAFPRDMQILIDGRSVYQPSFADVDWLFLGIVPEDIERIEVIRGPNNPFYGSNAVAGVINIITRLPLQDRGTTARITAGDLNTRHAVLRHGGRLGELDYRVTLNHQDNDGLEGNRNATNDSRDIQGISLRGTWHPRPADEVDIQLGFSDGELGAGDGTVEASLPHEKDVTSQYAYLSWRRSREDDSDLRWQFYHNRYTSDDSYRDLLSNAYGVDPATIAFLLAGTPDQVVNLGLYDYEGERYDMEVQYTSPAADRFSMVLGAGIRLNRLQSPRLTGRSDWLDELSERVFANLSYRASEQLLFNTGILAEHSDEHGAHVSPRLNASWLFNAQHSIRASFAQAHRNPSLLEKHFNTVYRLDDGTPYLIALTSADPDQETLQSLELGYIGYFLDRRLLVDAKLFRERTTDLIRLVDDLSIMHPFPLINSPGGINVRSSMNNGSKLVTGGEIQLKYQTAARDFISVQLSRLDTENTGDKRVNVGTGDGLFFPNERVAPTWTASLLLSKALPHGLEFSAGYYRLSRMVWLEPGGDRNKGYKRADARLAKRWRTRRTNIMLEGIVQNIGDEYETFRHDNYFDTRAYLRLTAEFL